MRGGNHVAVLLLVGGIPTSLGAQDTQQGVVDLGTLTLEAERRTDSLADVPIAVTVVDGRDIDEANIRDVQDLADKVPNFTLQTNASRTNPQYFIRGIGAVATVDPGAQQAVSTYIDGVYQPFASALVFDFADVDRVEVLRGPQGTLFGRNATAGAVNIFTRMPDATTGGFVKLGFGTENMREVAAVANFALPNNQGAARLSFLRSTQDGFIENALGDDLSAEDSAAIRARFLYTPTDRLTFDLILGAERIRDSGYAYVPVERTFDRRYDTPLDSIDDRDSENISLRTTYDFDGVRLTSITAWQRYDSLTENPQDILFGFPSEDLGFALSTEKEEGDSFSQEVLLQSTGDGPFEWTTGFFYESTDVEIDTGSRFTETSGFPFGFESTGNPTRNETEVFAIFADGSYQISDQLTLTLGARYTWESVDWSSSSVFNGTDVPGSKQSDSADFEAFTPRAVLEYQLNETTLLYGSLARGFKGGGFTTFNAGGPPTEFDPEFVQTFEVGAKYLSPDNRFFLGAAAFYNNWDDLQVFYLTTVNGVTQRLVSNAEAARSYGFELEASWRPSEQWALGGSVGYLNSDLTDVTNPLNGESLSGNRAPFSPEWTANLSAEYTTRLTSDAVLRLGTAVSYTSDYYFDVLNTQRQDDLVNLNLSAAVDGDGWSAGINVKNALDEDFYRWRFNSSGRDFAAAGEPLTAGAFFRAEF